MLLTNSATSELLATCFLFVFVLYAFIACVYMYMYMHDIFIRPLVTKLVIYNFISNLSLMRVNDFPFTN